MEPDLVGILKAVFPRDEIKGSLEKMNSGFWFLLPLIFVSSYSSLISTES